MRSPRSPDRRAMGTARLFGGAEARSLASSTSSRSPRSELLLAFTSGMCGNLHRYGKKAFVVSIDVASQHRFELLCRCHLASFLPREEDQSPSS